MEVFYYVRIARKRGEIFIESLAEYDEDKLYKGEFIPSEPYEMIISEGKKLYDVIGFQDVSNIAISERVYSLLKEQNFTGWRAYEINIKGVNEKYYGLQVTGRSGTLIEPKEAGFYKGYKFDLNTWDKSDFFCPKGTILFCTQRVKDFFQKNKATNIEFTNINEVQAYSIGNN